MKWKEINEPLAFLPTGATMLIQISKRRKDIFQFTINFCLQEFF